MVGVQRFRRSIGLVAAAFGVLFSMQTVAQFVVLLHSIGGSFAPLTVIPIWASVLGGPVAAAVHGYARRILWASVAAYALGVVALPFAFTQPIPQAPFPWVAWVSAVPMLYLALASTKPVLSIAIGILLAAQVGIALGTAGGLSPLDALVDALLMVFYAVGFTLVIAALRSGVRRAGRVQQALLDGHAAAQAQDATEAERRRTDALLHDAVLTTFLSAASAQTPDAEELAGRMAANAVRVLAHVSRSVEYGGAIRFAEPWADAGARLAALMPRFSVQTDGAGDVVLPASIADAMLEAMAEAMTNSVQHAAAEHRELRIMPLGPDGLRIVVRDDGVGFDLETVPLAGIATVVQQPLRRVDGRVDIETAPGCGCTVALSWGSIVMSGTAPLPEDTAVTA